MFQREGKFKIPKPKFNKGIHRSAQDLLPIIVYFKNNNFLPWSQNDECSAQSMCMLRELEDPEKKQQASMRRDGLTMLPADSQCQSVCLEITDLMTEIYSSPMIDAFLTHIFIIVAGFFLGIIFFSCYRANTPMADRRRLQLKRKFNFRGWDSFSWVNGLPAR